jgi:hypothetical protein
MISLSFLLLVQRMISLSFLMVNAKTCISLSISHSSVQRKRKKLERLTSPRHRGEMLRQKTLKVEDH